MTDDFAGPLNSAGAEAVKRKPPTGIEPGTLAFDVRCLSDCATEAGCLSEQSVVGYVCAVPLPRTLPSLDRATCRELSGKLEIGPTPLQTRQFYSCVITIDAVVARPCWILESERVICKLF